MKFLFFMGHPAHYHVFKNSIKELKTKGHTIYILIKKKDILEGLLNESGFEFCNILKDGRKDSKFGIICGVIKKDIKMFRFCIKYKPDLLLGYSAEIAHIGKLLNIPSINVNEDDARVIYTFSKVTNPFITYLLSPISCDNSEWNHKTIFYNGYHELTYLHPDNFAPSKNIVKKYFSPDEKYFIIRFAKLTAHHDVGIKGISTEIASEIINKLKIHGKIYITSERDLEPEFEQYRMNITPKDIHHVLFNANLYIGDSQTMAAEAGVLGTPFIRFNDFVGKIGYLKELEEKYKLGFGIKGNQPKLLLQKIDELLSVKNLKDIWDKRKEKMLRERINTNDFFVWFFENYPKSISIMKQNNEFQNQFLIKDN